MSYVRTIFLVALLSLKNRLDALVDRLAREAGYTQIQDFKDDLDAVAEEEGYVEAEEVSSPDDLMEIATFTNQSGLTFAAARLVADGGLDLLAQNPGLDDQPVRGPTSLAVAASLYATGDYAFHTPRFGYLTPTYAWYAAPPFI